MLSRFVSRELDSVMLAVFSTAMKMDPAVARPLSSLPQPKSFEQRLKQARQSAHPGPGVSAKLCVYRSPNAEMDPANAERKKPFLFQLLLHF